MEFEMIRNIFYNLHIYNILHSLLCIVPFCKRKSENFKETISRGTQKLRSVSDSQFENLVSSIYGLFDTETGIMPCDLKRCKCSKRERMTSDRNSLLENDIDKKSRDQSFKNDTRQYRAELSGSSICANTCRTSKENRNSQSNPSQRRSNSKDRPFIAYYKYKYLGQNKRHADSAQNSPGSTSTQYSLSPLANNTDQQHVSWKRKSKLENYVSPSDSRLTVLNNAPETLPACSCVHSGSIHSINTKTKTSSYTKSNYYSSNQNNNYEKCNNQNYKENGFSSRNYEQNQNRNICDLLNCNIMHPSTPKNSNSNSLLGESYNQKYKECTYKSRNNHQNSNERRKTSKNSKSNYDNSDVDKNYHYCKKGFENRTYDQKCNKKPNTSTKTNWNSLLGDNKEDRYQSKTYDQSSNQQRNTSKYSKSKYNNADLDSNYQNYKEDGYEGKNYDEISNQKQKKTCKRKCWENKKTSVPTKRSFNSSDEDNNYQNYKEDSYTEKYDQRPNQRNNTCNREICEIRKSPTPTKSSSNGSDDGNIHQNYNEDISLPGTSPLRNICNCRNKKRDTSRTKQKSSKSHKNRLACWDNCGSALAEKLHRQNKKRGIANDLTDATFSRAHRTAGAQYLSVNTLSSTEFNTRTASINKLKEASGIELEKKTENVSSFQYQLLNPTVNNKDSNYADTEDDCICYKLRQKCECGAKPDRHDIKDTINKNQQRKSDNPKTEGSQNIEDHDNARETEDTELTMDEVHSSEHDISDKKSSIQGTIIKNTISCTTLSTNSNKPDGYDELMVKPASYKGETHYKTEKKDEAYYKDIPICVIDHLLDHNVPFHILSERLP